MPFLRHRSKVEYEHKLETWLQDSFGNKKIMTNLLQSCFPTIIGDFTRCAMQNCLDASLISRGASFAKTEGYSWNGITSSYV